MWIFTSRGFVSIVAPKPPDASGSLVVRAREPGVLSRLFPSLSERRTPGRDYMYRMVVPRDDVARMVSSEVENLYYTNFKDSIPSSSGDYADACGDVWSTMMNLQGVHERRSGRR